MLSTDILAPESSIKKLEDFIVELKPGWHDIIQTFRPRSNQLLIAVIKLIMDRNYIYDTYGFDISFNTSYTMFYKSEKF